MSIDRSDVERIAHLARLALDEQDIPAYTKNLSSILHLVDEMQQINTDGVEPLAHPLDAIQRLRVDEVSESDQREKLQAVSPAVENGLFLVPKVIE
jgi:aspartyl-tRNA(Asn)/glutamyl-tRNA(Gln) amidotransferase subunit C